MSLQLWAPSEPVQSGKRAWLSRARVTFAPDSDHGKAASGKTLHYRALEGIDIHHCSFIQMNLDGCRDIYLRSHLGIFEG